MINILAAFGLYQLIKKFGFEVPMFDMTSLA
jgi:hypothetical protein